MSNQKQYKRLKKDSERYANLSKNQASKYMTQDEVQDRIDALGTEFGDIGMDMVQFTVEGQAWLDMTSDGRTNEQRMMSKLMQRRMLLACAGQLRGGLTAENICSAFGMYIGMCAVNPEFKAMTKQIKADVLGKVLESSDKYENGTYYGKNPIMKGIAKKRDKYLQAANQGRMPFTPDTAAVADIRLMKEAYEQMRDGQHNPEEVMQKYQDAKDTLEDLMSADGVTKSDMIYSKRVLLTHMAKKDEFYQTMVDELGYDKWFKKESENERILAYDEKGKPMIQNVNVWRGEFYTYDEHGMMEDVGENADFNIRKPMSELDFAKNVAKTMKTHDNAYNMFDKDDSNLARADMTQAAKAAFGDESARCVSNSPAENEMFNRTVDELKQYRKMAQHDWLNNIEGETVDDACKRAMILGMNGGVIEEMSATLYSDSYASTKYPECDVINGQQAADISSVSVAFVEATAGADLHDSELGRKANEISMWYARAAMSVESGIPLDFKDKETFDKLSEYIDSSDETRNRFNDIGKSVKDAINSYSATVSTMLDAGVDKDDAIEMLKWAEDRGSWFWTHSEGTPIAENIKGLEESRVWAAKCVNQMDLSGIDTTYKEREQEARQQSQNASWRYEQARAKFGDRNDYSYDDTQYE